jgi:hypothetical protein
MRSYAYGRRGIRYHNPTVPLGLLSHHDSRQQLDHPYFFLAKEDSDHSQFICKHSFVYVNLKYG